MIIAEEKRERIKMYGENDENENSARMNDYEQQADGETDKRTYRHLTRAKKKRNGKKSIRNILRSSFCWIYLDRQREAHEKEKTVQTPIDTEREEDSLSDRKVILIRSSFYRYCVNYFIEKENKFQGKINVEREIKNIVRDYRFFP